MTDILAQLEAAAWRDIEFPVSASEFGFSQEQAAHRYLFRDQQLIESLGRQNPTYSYTAPMREDIARGPYRDLFTVTYPKLLAACQDRTPGVLFDPFHGAVRCKCVSLREIRDVNRRDGVDVQLEFVVAPEESQRISDLGTVIATLEGARDQAGLFDRAVQRIPFEQSQPPEPLVDFFDAITGVGDQIQGARDQSAARLHNLAFRAGKAADAIDNLRNPNFAKERDAALRLQATLLDLEKKSSVTGARPVRTVTVRASATLASIAALHGMTVEQLFKLNPVLARAPMARAGTEIRVFAAQSNRNARAA